MGREDAIWHVIIDGKQHGPLSRSQVLEHLQDGQLVGSDPIWRPGFSDWKQVSELAEFWQPPNHGTVPPSSFAPPPTEQPKRDDVQIDAVVPAQAAPSNKKWSIWRAANAGLIVTMLILAVQIASGRGYDLANLAYTPGTGSLGELTGQILAVPLLFVIIALLVNIFKWRQPSSDAKATKGAIKFASMLVGIGLSLALYGQWFFSSMELISGTTRDEVISGMRSGCVKRQMSLRQGANPSENQISKYCNCIGDQIANKMTYKQVASGTTAPDVREYFKQQAEVAGLTCRTSMGL